MPIHISSANVRFNSHTLNNKKQIIHKLLHFPRIPSKPLLLDMLTLFKYMYKITCYLPTVFCSTIIQTIFALTLEGFNQQIPEINIPKKANNKKFHTPELCVAMCESNVSVEQITWTFGMNTLNCVWREIWSSTGSVYACNWAPIWYHNYDHWISIFINYTYPLATTGRSVFILHFVLLLEWKTCKRNWSKQHI